MPAEAGKLGEALQRTRRSARSPSAHKGGKTSFDFGEFKSEVASRKNPDGTISFITIVPGVEGFEFIAGSRGGKPTLVMRDSQHEYVFEEK